MRSVAFTTVTTGIAMLLTGCGPRDLEDCRLEAAKMPTNTGVQLANRVCMDRFHKKVDDGSWWKSDPLAEPK